MRAGVTVLIVLMAWPAAAQSQGEADLLRRIEALQQALAQQSRELEELRRLVAQIPPAGGPPAAVAAAAGPAPTAQEGRTEQRQNELPPDQLAASEFPGSFPIPNSDAALKIGGLVRVNWVSTSDALLVDDRFVTSAIPVEGSEEASRGSRVTVNARPSRFNFDLRTPTGVGHMRAFIEADFAGANNSLRLRHAYGQWRRLIFGQTWSTFSDPEAEPDGIDFEGLNAIILFRQAMIRWTLAPTERIRVAMAVEDPRPDLTGADGVNQTPDFITPRPLGTEAGRAPADRRPGAADSWRAARSRQRRRRRPWLGFHLQRSLAVAGVGRARQHHVPAQPGCGHRPLYQRPVGGRRTRRHLRPGRARDARTLRVLGLHRLRALVDRDIRSGLSFGIVGVDNIDIQPGDALHLTRRYASNIIWSPIPRLDMVAEFLWGFRINKDGRSGRATQTQIGATFRF